MLIFMHRVSKVNREWVNRPGGWSQDGAIAEECIAIKSEALINYINSYPDNIPRRLKALLCGARQNGNSLG